MVSLPGGMKGTGWGREGRPACNSLPRWRTRHHGRPAEPVTPVAEDSLPVAALSVFLTQCLRQLPESFHFHLANIVFKVARSEVPSEQEHADDDDKAVQEEAEEHLVCKFHLHLGLPAFEAVWFSSLTTLLNKWPIRIHVSILVRRNGPFSTNTTFLLHIFSTTSG